MTLECCCVFPHLSPTISEAALIFVPTPPSPHQPHLTTHLWLPRSLGIILGRFSPPLREQLRLVPLSCPPFPIPSLSAVLGHVGPTSFAKAAWGHMQHITVLELYTIIPGSGWLPTCNGMFLGYRCLAPMRVAGSQIPGPPPKDEARQMHRFYWSNTSGGLQGVEVWLF